MKLEVLPLLHSSQLNNLVKGFTKSLAIILWVLLKMVNTKRSKTNRRSYNSQQHRGCLFFEKKSVATKFVRLQFFVVNTHIYTNIYCHIWTSPLIMRGITTRPSYEYMVGI